LDTSTFATPVRVFHAFARQVAGSSREKRDAAEVAQQERLGDFFFMERVQDVLERQMFAGMLGLHLLQHPLDIAVHRPRPDGRFTGFFGITRPPFL
jgi:hypothetical protein